MPAPPSRIATFTALGFLQDEGIVDRVEVTDDWTFVIDGRRYDVEAAARFVEREQGTARRRLARRFARDHEAIARHRPLAA
jgi:hypothetical protein